MGKTYQNRKLLETDKIKDTFERINLNSEETNADLNELYFRDDENYNILNQKIDSKDFATNMRITLHTEGSAENHHAADTVFAPTPTIPETNVQKAVEKVDQRVGNLVASTGTSNAEIVDARNSSKYGPFVDLKSRLDSHENAAMPHILFNALDGKYYKYGEQISAQGKPQLIFEEVV